MNPGIDYIGIGCGALIINNNNETLLMKRGSKSKNEIGYWSKPGGAVEFGEKVEDAIKREIKEELDIEIELIKFLDFTDHIINSENQHWIAINFLAKIINGEPKIMEPNKHSEIKWFNLNDLPENITQTTIEPIQKYLNSLKNID
jgi:ADP-ribose pyrophosphatase